ncbi:hypothetical protein N480_13565 [Pseudoalteromonas luteoviolacea S2607]|uniref:NERD domain-containing protein n=1 Tax=Pseudoalteromonas luteoviolacea TaxID=43657 RepID=UPI0007B082FE|nr:NERD domain-containing protein [Pseudoalteromonas luteoviolacea]KZN38677.1 hypothetical protein N480_13565 [Pseudoalteromonas luteoviolacea S2607]
MNRWILFFIIFSSSVAANTEQLDQRQCARFASELQFLRQNNALKEGEDARLRRLIERLQTYCQSPRASSQITSQVDQNANRSFGVSIFMDEATRERWQRFFHKPMICHHGEQDFASAVKCAEQVAQQREAFEQLLRKEAMQKKNTVQALQQKDTQGAELLTTAEEAQSPRVDPILEADFDDKALDIVYEEPDRGHFGRFTMWLSVIIAGYVSIEILKFLLRPKQTTHIVRKRTFKETYKSLTSKLDNKKYIVLYRSMSPLLEELDIDGIVLSPFGVFVLVYCPQTGVIEADIQGEMWNVIQEGSSNFFLNPVNAAKLRVSNLASCIGAKSGVRYLVVFDEQTDFFPGKPFNCFTSKEVPLEVMRYTQFMFSYEQLRYFEQRLYSAENRLNPDSTLVSNS